MTVKKKTKKESLFVSGHRACHGCGMALGVRHILEATGSDVIVVSPTGCLETFTSPYGFSPWRVPWIHHVFENAPAVATGVVAALRAQGRDHTRVVAIGGPGAEKPRMLRTLLGASLEELTAGELDGSENRIISGSVFSGRAAESPVAFLGRYHLQVSVLPEDKERRLIGYLTPGLNRHSVFPIYLSKWLGEKNISFSTTTNGSQRGMVPIGTYEQVMPLDILPTQLLRALLVGDLDTAIALGCLELDEDDIALCTYACPAKYEYGPVLRSVLDTIEKEG